MGAAPPPAVAGARTLTEPTSRSAPPALAGDASVRTQGAAQAGTQSTVVLDAPSPPPAPQPPAAPLRPQPEPIQSLPPVPLPAPTTLMGAGCGTAGLGRADQGAGVELPTATAGSPVTPVPSVMVLQVTGDWARPSCGAEDPATRPD